LAERVDGEAARTLEPALISGARKRLEESEPVAGGAVADACPFSSPWAPALQINSAPASSSSSSRYSHAPAIAPGAPVHHWRRMRPSVPASCGRGDPGQLARPPSQNAVRVNTAAVSAPSASSGSRRSRTSVLLRRRAPYRARGSRRPAARARRRPGVRVALRPTRAPPPPTSVSYWLEKPAAIWYSRARVNP
jgi:hypothetical protein